MATASAGSVTGDRILDIAERLVQTRGYNGFSYADIAAELCITKASLHYHFASKGRLGERLVERYHARFMAVLAEIETTEGDAVGRLSAYAAVYARVLESGRICLCGMLATDYRTLPGPVQERVRAFFAANHAWLGAVVADGQASARITFVGSLEDAARLMLSALEGAMLVAHALGDPEHFRAASEALLRGLHGR